jgi:hypothetical protein
LRSLEFASTPGPWQAGVRKLAMQLNHTPVPESVKPTYVANPFPFAPVPYEMAEDPRLKDLDIRVAIALLKWLRDRPTCWVVNGELAKQCRVKVRALQLSFQRLESAGWFRFDRTMANVSQRIVVAVWREGGANLCAPSAIPCALGAQNGAPNEECLTGESLGESSPPPSVIVMNRTPPPAPSSPTLDGVRNPTPDDRLLERTRAALSGLVGLTGKAKTKGVNATWRLVMRVMGDDESWRGLHCDICHQIADDRLTLEHFWIAYESTRMKQEWKTDPDPLLSFGAYFQRTLNNQRDGLTREDEDQAFDEETDERRANGEF